MQDEVKLTPEESGKIAEALAGVDKATAALRLAEAKFEVERAELCLSHGKNPDVWTPARSADGAWSLRRPKG